MVFEDIETSSTSAYKGSPPIPDIGEDEPFLNVVRSLFTYVHVVGLLPFLLLSFWDVS